VYILIIQEFIQNLISKGIWAFSFGDAQAVMGVQTANRISMMLKNGRLVSPVRGFYAIVPEEDILYRRLSPLRFIDAMMKHLQVPYYIGLLSAANYRGIAPQAPQKLQVITFPSRRNIARNEFGILFYRKKDIESFPTEQGKTATGYFRLSSPAGTLFDLVQWYKSVGGLEYILELLLELGPEIKLLDLQQVISGFPSPVLQRGGYLLQLAGHEKQAQTVYGYLQKRKYRYTLLNPTDGKSYPSSDPRWRLHLNERLELP